MPLITGRGMHTDLGQTMTMAEWKLLGRIVTEAGFSFALEDGIDVLTSLHHRGFIEPAEGPGWLYVATGSGKNRWNRSDGDPERCAWRLRNEGLLDKEPSSS